MRRGRVYAISAAAVLAIVVGCVRRLPVEGDSVGSGDPTAGRGDSGAEPPTHTAAPQLHWPPPRASATAQVGAPLLAGVETLYELATRFSAVLTSRGYGDLNWFLTPTGFVTVTRCERIGPEGVSLEHPRFSTEIGKIGDLSFTKLLGAIFHAREGRFRVVMLVVTSSPNSMYDPLPSVDDGLQVIRLGQNGAAQIPEELLTKSSRGYAAYYLFYEIERTGEARPRLVYSTALTAAQHLAATKLPIE